MHQKLHASNTRTILQFSSISADNKFTSNPINYKSMLSTIRAKILLTTASIVVLSLVSMSLMTFFVTKTYNRRSTDASLSAIAKGHVQNIAEWVAIRRNMIISTEEASLSSDPVPVFRQIARAGGFPNVYAGYETRSVKLADSTGVPDDFDPTGRPWYRAAVDAGKPVVTAPYVDLQTHQLVVSFPAPVYASGKLMGVVSGDVTMGSIIESVRSIRPTVSSFAFLVDGQGRIIAHPNTALTLRPVSEVANGMSFSLLAQLSKTGDVASIAIDGCPKLISVHAIEGTDWDLVIALDENEADAGLHAMELSTGIAALVVALLAVLIVSAVTHTAFLRLSGIRDALRDIANGAGDLTRRLPTSGNDEVSHIAASFNEFVAKIQSVLSNVKGASGAVSTAATEIASGNRDLAARTEQTAASLQQTAATMEQITATVRQASNATSIASTGASEASSIARRGESVVDSAVKMMERIEEASGKVADITSVIEGIAFQTNILALNAAVEAARAGGQGRGFAVVASEVRNLAQRSATAAREISELIESTVASVHSGSALVKETGVSMRETANGIARVAVTIDEVARAASEQSHGIVEVGRAISQLDDMTQRNAALVEQATAAAVSLEEQASHLEAQVSQFSI